MEFDYKQTLTDLGYTVDPVKMLEIKEDVKYDPLTNAFLDADLQVMEISDVIQLLQDLADMAPSKWAHIMSAEDLKEVKQEWLIDGILPQGQAGFVLAPPKSYKSLFTMKMALAVASGKDFAGHKVKKSNVLVIANENTESDEAGRMRLMASEYPHGLFYDFSREVKIETIEQIKPLILARDIKLVILDPLYLSVEGGNDVLMKPTECTAILTHLGDFMREFKDVTFVIVHHTKKLGDARIQGKNFEVIPDDAFGSTFINAWRQFIFCLTPHDWGSSVTIDGRGYSPDFILACKINSFGFECIEVPTQ